MKKGFGVNVKKIIVMGLITMLLFGSVGCNKQSVATTNESSNTQSSETVKPDTSVVQTENKIVEQSDEVKADPYKIIVFTLKSSGQLNDAFNAFLGSVSSELNFEYDVRYKGDNASEYLSKVQTAIAEGYQGIISMKDEGNTNEIVALCEENGVYFGNIWNNQGASLNASSGGYSFLNNPYFVGGLTDCEDSMNSEAAVYTEAVAKAYASLSDEQKVGSIGFVTMPPAWQPNQVIAVENMYKLLKSPESEGGYGIPDSAFALNGIVKRETEEKVGGKPIAAGSIIWPSMDVTSKKLESKYFDQNPNLQLLISTLAYSFINPALDSANKLTSMKVWVTGFDNEPALVTNFGTLGNQTYQGCRTAPIESLAMPLVQILDKLAGNSYSDKEEALAEFSEITDANKFKLKDIQLKASPTIVISDDLEMDAYLNHNVYGTGNGADALVNVETLKQLMVTYNDEATYGQLVSVFTTGSQLISIEKVVEHAKQ